MLDATRRRNKNNNNKNAAWNAELEEWCVAWGCLLGTGNVVSGHEASKHCHHHLGLSLRDVFGKRVDACAQFAGHRDGVLGVGQSLLLRKNAAREQAR